MAMVTCNECGGEMSDRALACPKCGHARPRPEFEAPPPPSKVMSNRKLSKVNYQVRPPKTRWGVWVATGVGLAFLLALVFSPTLADALKSRVLGLFGVETSTPKPAEAPRTEGE